LNLKSSSTGGNDGRHGLRSMVEPISHNVEVRCILKTTSLTKSRNLNTFKLVLPYSDIHCYGIKVSGYGSPSISFLHHSFLFDIMPRSPTPSKTLKSCSTVTTSPLADHPLSAGGRFVTPPAARSSAQTLDAEAAANVCEQSLLTLRAVCLHDTLSPQLRLVLKPKRTQSYLNILLSRMLLFLRHIIPSQS
jgi:hypothetical protein